MKRRCTTPFAVRRLFIHVLDTRRHSDSKQHFGWSLRIFIVSLLEAILAHNMTKAPTMHRVTLFIRFGYSYASNLERAIRTLSITGLVASIVIRSLISFVSFIFFLVDLDLESKPDIFFKVAIHMWFIISIPFLLISITFLWDYRQRSISPTVFRYISPPTPYLFWSQYSVLYYSLMNT